MPPAPENTALWAGAACGTTMWQYMDTGRHCMWFPSWNVVVVGGWGRYLTAPLFHRGTKNNQSARSPYSSSSPPKKHKPIPPTYTCIFTAVLFVVLCDLGRKGLQLLKRHNMTTPLSFFSNLNDLKVFLQFYWTQVWSYCVALSLTGAEESDVVIVW